MQPKPPVCKKCLIVVGITTLLVIVVSRQAGGVAKEKLKNRNCPTYVTTACEKKMVRNLKGVLNATLYFIVANFATRNNGVNTKSCVMPLVTSPLSVNQNTQVAMSVVLLPEFKQSSLTLFRLGGAPHWFLPGCAKTACSTLMKLSDF